MASGDLTLSPALWFSVLRQLSEVSRVLFFNSVLLNSLLTLTAPSLNAYMYVCVYAYIMDICVYTYVYINNHLCLYMHVCMYVYIYIYTYIYAHIYNMHIYTYICTCV